MLPNSLHGGQLAPNVPSKIGFATGAAYASEAASRNDIRVGFEAADAPAGTAEAAVYWMCKGGSSITPDYKSSSQVGFSSVYLATSAR